MAKKTTLAGAAAGAAATIGVLAIMGQGTQWPAYTVIFTDTDNLQEKWDNGDLGGGGTPGGTEGQLQVNESGAFGAVAEGTAGQLLTSAGAGAAPTFQDAPPTDLYCAAEIAGVCLLRLNEPLDTDGDGDPDTVHVWKDFDGNGLVETADIMAAQAALTDMDGQRLLYVVGGEFHAPASLTLPGSGDDKEFYPTLVSLANNTTLRCHSWDSVTIWAPIYNVHANFEDGWSVIGGDNAGKLGNESLAVYDCDVDGGMPKCLAGESEADHCYDTTGVLTDTNLTQGIRIHDTVGAIVAGNHVHHTPHSAIYSKNLKNSLIERNFTSDCGDYRNAAVLREDGQSSQPGIYHYAASDPRTANNETYGVTTRYNLIRRCTHGIEHRRGDSGVPRMKQMVVEGNRISFVRAIAYSDGGTEGALWKDNISHGGQFVMSTAPTSYSHNEASIGFVSRGNVLMGPPSAYGARSTALHSAVIGPYHMNSDIELDVYLADQDCMQVFGNNPSLRISGTFRGCGRHGILAGGVSAISNTLFEDFTIDNWGTTFGPGAVGLYFQFGGTDNVIRNGNFVGQKFRAIQMSGTANTYPASRNLFESIVIDGRWPLFVGEYCINAACSQGLPTLPSCGVDEDLQWLVAVDAQNNNDATAGNGSVRNTLRCESSAWVDWQFDMREAVFLNFSATSDHDGGASKGNMFSDLVIRNWSDGYHDGLMYNAIKFTDGAWEGTVFDGVRIESQGPTIGEFPLSDGIVLSNGAPTGTIGRDSITCAGLRGTCDGFGAAHGDATLEAGLSSTASTVTVLPLVYVPLSGTFADTGSSSSHWTQQGTSSEFCYAGDPDRRWAGSIDFSGTRTTGGGSTELGSFALGVSLDGPGITDGDEVEELPVLWSRDDPQSAGFAFIADSFPDGACVALMVATAAGDTVEMYNANYTFYTID